MRGAILSMWLSVWLSVSLVACSSGGGSLRVDLRTDYVPVLEVARIETAVDGEDIVELPIEQSEDLIGGFRIASYDGLANGMRRVSVLLIGPDGSPVASQRVLVLIRGATAITIPITRNCAEVSCDPGSLCYGGACVDERCELTEAEYCGAPSCTSAADCPPRDDCAPPVCDLGACWYVADDALCDEDGAYCHPERGCEPAGMVDAGPADASFDATFDATFDAGTDAPIDAPVDAPPDVPVDAGTDACACVPGTTRPCGGACDGMGVQTCTAACTWTVGCDIPEGGCIPGTEERVNRDGCMGPFRNCRTCQPNCMFGDWSFCWPDDNPDCPT